MGNSPHATDQPDKTGSGVFNEGGADPGGVMDVAAELERARAAHASQAWADACDVFAAIDAVAPLAVADLEQWSEAADILGRAEAISVLQRVYQARVDAGEIGAAVRAAFWLSHALNFNGEFAKAGGWIARAGRLLQTQPDCAERGYLLIPDAERQHGERDYAAALASAERAAELGARCGDRDLVTAATHIQARAVIQLGRVEEGLGLLDEAMLGVTAGNTSPRVTGWIYCGTIGACHDLHEVRRAREWTIALNAWCDALPQFTGAYSGVCRIHRSELLQLGGSWTDAVREAKLACEHLTRGYGERVAGAAFYQLGEIHRLRGQHSDAEAAYQRASQYGWNTQPGLALLRLAQGKVDASVAAIRRALGEESEPLARSRLLPAHVEIMLAAKDLDAARDDVTELSKVADNYPTPALQAQARLAQGAVLLAAGCAEEALPVLRAAWRTWQDLDAPYESARVRTLIGRACIALGDADTASMEWDAARQVFHRLGAAPDLTRLHALARPHEGADASGLSARQLEVLRLLAAGKTNRTIATELYLSEKTVDRHVSNIFTKLGVASRTAAATYALEHHLT
jgi:DNA-binding CsgD family transcriptional regulator/tetratricopeptide (TPR) repeat protein